jgi:transcriptional regulator with XRE-family HTH domain
MAQETSSGVDTAWFKARLADRQISQRSLARTLGLDASALSLMFRGKRVMKIAEAVAIARLLGVPADEVMAHAGVRVDSKNELVPIAGFMDGTSEAHVSMNSMGSVPHPGGDLPAELNACICRTAGSDLEYMDGWILFCADMTGGIQPEAVGRLSYVKITDGVVYVARLQRGTARGRWTLAGPAIYSEDLRIDWANPILAILP